METYRVSKFCAVCGEIHLVRSAKRSIKIDTINGLTDTGARDRGMFSRVAKENSMIYRPSPAFRFSWNEEKNIYSTVRSFSLKRNEV